MIKRLTLLHSNDMHGDFPAEQVDEKLTGGVSMHSRIQRGTGRWKTFSGS